MSLLKPVRGTHDVLPEENRRRRHIEDTAFAIAQRYGYGEIATPIFEFTEVFSRTLGDTSDVVTKEMYTFADRAGDSLTLRPENTAGVVRALLSNGLAHHLPLKFFYRGPMFRYERPQKGRLRQFQQIGVELLGVSSPLADAEVIALGADILRALGVADKVTLELNTLGDAESRQVYRKRLLEYLRDHRNRLSPDSLVRLDRNPLRILDSKDEGDRTVIEQAPSIEDSLNPPSRDFFEQLRAALKAMDVDYRINPRMVRGLDYYCHTAFEFTTAALGAQGAVLAGGRYDGLVEQMGGPPTPGTGWAAGVERLAMLVVDHGSPVQRPIAVIPADGEQMEPALALCQRLRRDDFNVDLVYSGNVGKRMKRANKVNARVAIILGEHEISRGVAAVRDMDTGAQEEVALDRLNAHLSSLT